MYRGRLCRNNCCSSSRPTEVSRVLSVGALQRVTLSSPTRCQCLPPAAVGRLKQEKPALGSALIHGETSVWSANITAKQASKLTQEQITEYKGVFEMFDEEGNGDVKTQELERLMSLMGINPTKRELIQMAKDVDKDGKGLFNCDSFLGLMALYNERTKNQNAELRAAFKVFDKEAKGYIDWNTLKYVLMNAGEPLNEIEAEQMMKEADKDGDGTINYEEFVAMMTGDSFKMS